MEDNYVCKGSILNAEHKEFRKWSAVSAILSSSASVVGCLLIIVTYWCWRDLRTTSRTILLYIAIADLATALGYIFGSSTYLHCKFYNVSRSHCNDGFSGLGIENQCKAGIYYQMCKWQSFVTTWSSVSSFFWTTVLAFYLYMTIVHKLYKFVRKIMPLFHVLSWGVGLALCIAGVLKHWLGPSVDDTAVSWCFVADKKFMYRPNITRKLYSEDQRLLQLVMGKGWEMTCYVLIVGFYLLTKIHIEIEVSAPVHFSRVCV